MSMLDEYRAKYPRYSEVDDATLGRALYEKHYSDKLSFDEFSVKAGIQSEPKASSMPDEVQGEQQQQPYGEPIVRDGQYQVGVNTTEQPVRENPFTLKTAFDTAQSLVGIRDATKTMLTAAPADVVGNIGGGIQMYANPNDPMAGPDAKERIANTLTYQPKSEMGKAIIARMGELSGEYISPYIEKARLGDEALAAGMPEPVARFAEAIPENIGAVVSAFGVPKSNPRGIDRAGIPYEVKPPMKLNAAGNPVSPMSKKATIATDLRNNPTMKRTAAHKLDPNATYKGRSISTMKDPLAKKALKQGWSEHMVASTKGHNDATKLKIKKMVQLGRDMDESLENKMKMRYSDVPGKSLESRYVFLNESNKSAGKLLGKVAKDLGDNGVIVDVTSAVKYLDDQLKELGVTVKNGNLDFSKARIVSGDQALINESINHIRNVLNDSKGGKINFESAHRLKQIIRKSGLSYKETFAKPGASPETQGLFKGFTNKVDAVLDKVSPAYDKQNIKFAETRDMLSKIEQIGKDNILTDVPYTTLGDLMRRITGRTVSRGRVIEIANNVDDVTRRYGGKFDDDLLTQAHLATEMEDVLGIAAETSFIGDSARAAQAATSPSLTNAAELLDKGARLLKRQSREAALDSLESLTRTR